MYYNYAIQILIPVNFGAKAMRIKAIKMKKVEVRLQLSYFLFSFLMFRKKLFSLFSGFLDDSHAIRELPLLYQLYKLIESSKELGVSETEACAYLGQTKLNGRAMVKNLLKNSIIEFYSTSQKRQTVRR